MEDIMTIMPRIKVMISSIMVSMIGSFEGTGKLMVIK